MKSRASTLRVLLPVAGAAVALASLVACGDSGSGGSGGSGGAPVVGGNGGDGGTPVVGGNGGTPVVGGNGGDGGTPVVGGSGGEGGEGGAGGAPDNTPVVDFTMVGTPGWEPVDYHQFSATLGNEFEFFNDVLEEILPPPGHAFHPQIGIGPGAAHAGPYDNEFAATLMSLGYVDKNTFPAAEGLLPEGMLSIFMVVPSAGAPTGSSPDFASGPIIPNTLFPITVQVDAYQDGELLDGYSYGFEVPALDDQLNPPFDVDGHSHFPMFNANYFDGLEIPGTIVTVIQMTDTDGEGWTITTDTAVGP